MTIHSSEFHAKILLFGEYSIIHNSMGLTIPYEQYKGKLSFIDNDDDKFAGKSNENLGKFSSYLVDLQNRGKIKAKFKLDDLEKDIENGLYFESNIPQGFGIGSSGALCAAIYDQYAEDKIVNDRKLKNREIIRLKDIFSQMESYFHGKSSGIDPLNCYLKEPLLIKNRISIDKIKLDHTAESKSGMFLIDTGQTGETAPLVDLFLEKCKNEGFMSSVLNELIPANNSCIKSFVKGEVKEFYRDIKKVSKYLLQNLSPMIPEPFIEVWKKGLDTSSYYLKLCGSGGGGFLLGFAEDLEYAREELEKAQIKIIPLTATVPS